MTCVILYGPRQKKLKFRTESLGTWRIMEDYHLAFGVCGAMHFSVIKRMLTFMLTLKVLTSLFVGCVEPEPCLSEVLVIDYPGSVNWRKKLEVYREGRFMAIK